MQGLDERLLGRVHVLVLVDEEVAEPLHCLAVPAGPQRVDDLSHHEGEVDKLVGFHLLAQQPESSS